MEEKKTLKEKAKEVVEKVKTKVVDVKKDVTDFMKENPSMIPGLCTGFGMILVAGIKIISNLANASPDACRIESEISGCEYVTRHPLTNGEILELEAHMSAGESIGESLDQMGLLKDEKRRRK